MKQTIALYQVDAFTNQLFQSEYDFVSRFFAPRAGINEDPVTGSAHCTLAPYWLYATSGTQKIFL